jgi:hypothetical protein
LCPDAWPGRRRRAREVKADLFIAAGPRPGGDAKSGGMARYERIGATRLTPVSGRRPKVSDREDPFGASIRCTADPAEADKRIRSKWSRVMRQAAACKCSLGQLGVQ